MEIISRRRGARRDQLKYRRTFTPESGMQFGFTVSAKEFVLAKLPLSGRLAVK
jgi:hypothetical protein